MNQIMKTAALYVHGKGGSAQEAEHYQTLLPGITVIGLDYQTEAPWKTGKEIEKASRGLKSDFDRVLLIANSIGAYYSMHADLSGIIDRALFVSPIVDMETLISGMMVHAGVSEEELERKKTVITDWGDELSWDYLCYVRDNPLRWSIPTDVLYGSADHLQSRESIRRFVDSTGSSLTILENGEHWFHTEDQMRFLDEWVLNHIQF